MVEDIEVSPPKAHEVRIEIYYTGVCHTGKPPFQCSLPEIGTTTKEMDVLNWVSLLTRIEQMRTHCQERTPKVPSLLF